MKKAFSIILILSSGFMLSCHRDPEPTITDHEFTEVKAEAQFKTCDITCHNEGVQRSDRVYARVLLSLHGSMEDVEIFPMEETDSCLRCHIGNLEEGTQYYYTFEAYTNVEAYRAKETYHFTTQVSSGISVTTGEVTDITQTTAKGRGMVTAAEGVMVTERGLCWGTGHNPTVQGSHSSNGYGTGEYIVMMPELSPNTQYYVRAYAVSTTGTEYGAEVNFVTNGADLPEVVTGQVTGITATTAVGHGQVISEGISPVTERGVCWSTGHDPSVNDCCSIAGSGLGNFSVTMSGLVPRTTYYLRAFATNEHGTTYGAEVCFVAIEGQPEVETVSITDITATSAVGHGKVTADGGSSVTGRGFCWSKEHNPSINNEHISVGNGLGDFEAIIDSLSDNSTYYLRTYATNEQGIVYGNEVNFTTEQNIVLPTVTTTPPTEITSTSAHTGGNVTDDAGNLIIVRGVCWDTSHNPVVSGNHTTDGGGAGQFTSLITDLNVFTTYYVRAYATTIEGTAYGNEVSFMTMPNLPDLSSVTVTNVTDATATCSACVTNSGGDNVIERGICWATNSQPTIDGKHIECGSGLGSFSVDISGLVANKSYYVRAYAKNGAGTAYGDVVLFKTLKWYNAGIIGALPGKFTVQSNGKQVCFSQGNLQYKASSRTWQFAEAQWQYVGDANTSISSGNDDWIDLFGWATSGYSHGALCYQPWSTSNNNNYYFAYGESTYNLYDQTGKADWGYNKISNGGNQENQWRTLSGGSNGEWNYLLNVRTTASGIRFVKAIVFGKNGVILVPDDWDSSMCELHETNNHAAEYSSNTISSAKWNSILEPSGCVFIPAAGYRSQYAVYHVGSDGCYWSSSHTSTSESSGLFIFDDQMGLSDAVRCYGYSVRLVRDLN